VRIEQLEILAVVARLGSFRRAAEELHISQPALSESVRSLERNSASTCWSEGATAPRSAIQAASFSPTSSPCSTRSTGCAKPLVSSTGAFA